MTSPITPVRLYKKYIVEVTHFDGNKTAYTGTFNQTQCNEINVVIGSGGLRKKHALQLINIWNNQPFTKQWPKYHYSLPAYELLEST
jgi:hypothetical protein